MEHRTTCPRCRRPLTTCWCAALVPVQSRTRVVFLQHPREARVAVSTCRMAHLSLPGSSMFVTAYPDRQAELAELLTQPDTYLLFPSPGAIDVDDAPPPATLVIADGTWSNAKKLVERSALVRRLPRLAFHPDFTSNYRIRSEPADHCLSTIEATAHVLERLERAPGRYVPMLAAFDSMIETQLGYIGTGGRRHVRRPRAPKTVVDPRAQLVALHDRLVLLHIEANTWKIGTIDPPVFEALQILAVRVATGERFTALLAPRRPVSDRAALHVGATEAELAAAAPLAATQAAWQAFLGDDAVFGVWGYQSLALLRGEPGWAVAPGVDLREMRRKLIGADEPLPEGAGRGVQRFAGLVTLYAELLATGQSRD